MGLIYLVIVGAVAGHFATRIMRIEANPAVTIGIGIAGALVGGFILQGALAVLGLLGGIIGAVAKYEDERTELEAAGIQVTFNYFSEVGKGFADHVSQIMAKGESSR